jgi:hypothetical protein
MDPTLNREVGVGGLLDSAYLRYAANDKYEELIWH